MGYVKRKLRNGPVIEVDTQILSWRKNKKVPYVKQTKQRFGGPKKKKALNIDFFGDSQVVPVGSKKSKKAIPYNYNQYTPDNRDDKVSDLPQSQAVRKPVKTLTMVEYTPEEAAKLIKEIQ